MAEDFFFGSHDFVPFRPAGAFMYLAVNGNVLDVYDSPIAAADNVYLHVTGYMPWDRLDGIIDGPTDLSEWNFVEI